ncbi:hypothetical protein [Burkholderia vietnamiensis]|uniref:hypothetical protein n=1 Tax=Burkholderia vietnamiensis TaxID=60552 RepID=UPI001D154745|nr:hypothetical protein [Burkholderia vietnamiensis]UEC05582.1 hypothetical protein LK462_34665 [Burkholderia vietnamiensis]
MSIAPQFFIQQKGGLNGHEVRVKLSLQQDDRFRMRTFIVSASGVSADDLGVHTEVEATGEIRVLLVAHTVDGKRENVVCGELAEISALGEVDEKEKNLFVARLGNDLDRAFADAVFALGEPQVALAHAVVQAGAVGGPLVPGPSLASIGLAVKPAATGWKAFVPATPKAWLVTGVVVCALALVVYGVVRQVRGAGQQAQDDLALSGPNGALEAKIKSQIDDAVRNPNSTAGYNGMNVALATMRAMGLNPGKANAGCLVGLGK